MCKREAIPVFWSNYVISNLDSINDRLANGWEVERVDKLPDNNINVLMYILKKEENKTKENFDDGWVDC